MSSDHDLARPPPPPSSDPDALMTSSFPANDGQALDQMASRSDGLVQMDPHVHSEGNQTGALFPAAQKFTITGGTFTSHVQQQIVPREPPPDFRTIPLGDIDLQAELRPGDSTYHGYLRRRQPGRAVRRIYSAKVEGRDMTVVVYEGDEQAKEDWMKEVKKMSSLRHPNLLQLYGIASNGRTYAAIYHGGLISVDHMLDYHRANPMMRVNIRVQLSAEFCLHLRVWPMPLGCPSQYHTSSAPPPAASASQWTRKGRRLLSRQCYGHLHMYRPRNLGDQIPRTS
ncbi:hypothetical protein C8F01DRAFT_332097 [Mycena amicta]|nr:hypothetical protein C8F01DRAFT_332097 [Mycena amicta]